MDDIGDYIYLIIIAVAGLSSLLKKKKEKPTQVPDEDYKPVTEDIWEDFLPENPEVKVPEPATSFFDWENKATKIATYENTDDSSTLRAKNKVEKYKSSMKQAQKKVVIEESVYPELNIELSTIEDARKAFIYAEIFNKKY